MAVNMWVKRNYRFALWGISNDMTLQIKVCRDRPQLSPNQPNHFFHFDTHLLLLNPCWSLGIRRLLLQRKPAGSRGRTVRNLFTASHTLRIISQFHTARCTEKNKSTASDGTQHPSPSLFNWNQYWETRWEVCIPDVSFNCLHFTQYNFCFESTLQTIKSPNLKDGWTAPTVTYLLYTSLLITIDN